jgi:hypothetical protein
MHHHARHAQVFGQRSHGPLRRVRWPGFQSGIQNLLLHLWCQRPARPVPRWLRSQRLHPACAKRGAGGDHRRARQAELFGNRVIRHSSLGQQNHSAFLGHSLRRCSGADQITQRRKVVNGRCCISCANTSLPRFIDGPHERPLRRVAEASFAVQIETKRIRQLCVCHQQFTEAKRQNVGTLLAPPRNI